MVFAVILPLWFIYVTCLCLDCKRTALRSSYFQRRRVADVAFGLRLRYHLYIDRQSEEAIDSRRTRPSVRGAADRNRTRSTEEEGRNRTLEGATAPSGYTWEEKARLIYIRVSNTPDAGSAD